MGCLKTLHAAAPSQTSVSLVIWAGGLQPALFLLSSPAAGGSMRLGQRTPWDGMGPSPPSPLGKEVGGDRMVAAS